MKKLLIIGGSHSELPLILSAKEMGFYVYTTGFFKNDIGHSFSDKYIYADFSNKDDILKIVKEYNIDFIVPGCNDFAIFTAAYINEKLLLGEYDNCITTEILHHKHLFKQYAEKLNLNVPKTIYINDLLDNKIEFPLIVKPVDLSGGKGIKKVNNIKELEEAIYNIHKISKQKEIVLEEFIEGDYYSVSMLIKNKKIVFDFFAKEYFYLNKYLVEGAYSYNISENIKISLYEMIEFMIEDLDLVDGLLHIQFIVKDNIPYIGEITRRPPGDLYLKLVEYSTGINYTKEIIKVYCKMELSDNFNISHRNIIRHCIMSGKNGIFSFLNFNNANVEILDFFPLIKIGEKIDKYLYQKLGIIFCEIKEKHNIEKEINNIIKPIIKV